MLCTPQIEGSDLARVMNRDHTELARKRSKEESRNQ